MTSVPSELHSMVSVATNAYLLLLVVLHELLSTHQVERRVLLQLPVGVVSDASACDVWLPSQCHPGNVYDGLGNSNRDAF